MDALTRTKLRRMDARLKRLEALAAIGPSLLALAAAYQPPPIELGGTPSTEPSTAPRRSSTTHERRSTATTADDMGPSVPPTDGRGTLRPPGTPLAQR